MSKLTHDLSNFTNDFKPGITPTNVGNSLYQNSNTNHMSSEKVEEMDFSDITISSFDDFTNNVVEIGTNIVGITKSILDESKELANSATDWLANDAIPTIETIGSNVNTFLTRTGATVGTAVVSLGEGIGKLGEAIVDTGAMAVTAFASIPTLIIDVGGNIYSKITGNEWESLTNKMWEVTKAFVAKKHVANWFDSFYENNTFGNWLKTNAFFFENTREISSGIGYTVGIIGLTILTGGVGGVASGTAGIAGVAGIGKGAEDAWGKGASTVGGLTSGVLNGLWEGFQFFIGAKINGINVFGSQTPTIKTKLVNSLIHVCLDGINGGAETFARTLIDTCYKDGYTDTNGNYIQYTDADSILKRLQENFDDLGGFNNVLTGALTGSVMSAISETFDLGKYFKDTSSEKNAKKLLESLKNNEITISKFNSKINKISAFGLETIIKECDNVNILNEVSQAAELNTLSKVYKDLLEDSEALNKVISSLESNNLNKILTNFDDKLTEQIIDQTSLINLTSIINKLDDNNTIKLLNHKFKFAEIHNSLINSLDSNKLRNLFDNGLLDNTKKYLGKSLNGGTAPMIEVNTLLNIIDDDDLFKIFSNEGGNFIDASSSKIFLDASRKEYLLAFDELNNMINNNNYQHAFSDTELIRIASLAGITQDKFLFNNGINVQTLLSTEAILGNTLNIGKYKINTGDFLSWISEHGDDTLNKNFQLFDDISNKEAISCLKDLYSKVKDYRNRGFSVYLGNENNIQELIKSLDNGAFDIENTLKNISDINTTSLKDELLKSIDGIKEPTMIAKKLYDELNKRVNYSVKWMQVDRNANFINEKTTIYNQNISLDNIKTGDNIICKGWSQLYKEALEMAGFDESKITIEGGNNLGSHKWISIDLGDGNFILADATNAINGSTDLLKSKIGEPELGFMILNPGKILSDAKGRIQGLSKMPLDYFKKPELRAVYDDVIKGNVDNLDNNLRNITGEITDSKISEIAANFKKTGLVEKIFGNDLTESINSVLWNTELPENVKGVEAYSYLRKLINVLAEGNDNIRSNFNINLYVNEADDSLNVIQMYSDGSPIYEIIGDKIGKIVTSSKTELEKYLYGYNVVI